MYCPYDGHIHDFRPMGKVEAALEGVPEHYERCIKCQQFRVPESK